jgi:hypothetical protein
VQINQISNIMNACDIYGLLAAVLILSAVILPAVAVGLLFASVILGAVWVLGECVPGDDPERVTE